MTPAALSFHASHASGKEERLLLIVDDDEAMLHSLVALVQRFYPVVSAHSGEEALRLLQDGVRPQVILCDHLMPGMTGDDFLAKSVEYVPHAVRAIMTGYASIQEILHGINQGHTYLYLTKPWQISEILQTIRLCFQHYDLSTENRRHFHEFEQQESLLNRIRADLKMAVETLEVLNRRTLADFYRTARTLGSVMSGEEGFHFQNHAEFVARVCRVLGTRLGLDDATALQLEIAALLHDIGKIGLPRSVIRADPQGLTGGNRALYESHVARGVERIAGIKRLERVAMIMVQHHERIDGSGFPFRLQGKEILLESHILGIADFYHNFVYRFDPPGGRRPSPGSPVSLFQGGPGSGPGPVIPSPIPSPLSSLSSLGSLSTLTAADRGLRQRVATLYLTQNRHQFDPMVYQAFFDLAASGDIPELRLIY